MDKQNLDTLISELKRDEGVRDTPYKDTVGIWTIGIGHNMQAKPLPKDWTFPLTIKQIDKIAEDDLDDVFYGLDRSLPWWRDLSPGRQRMMANLAFNLGIAGLLAFKNTLIAIKERRWIDAAAGLRNSKWAGQVKSRCDRMCDLMLGVVK